MSVFPRQFRMCGKKIYNTTVIIYTRIVKMGNRMCTRIVIIGNIMCHRIVLIGG